MGRRGRPPHPDILTPREWEVLELLRQGLSNPEIAQRLGISRAGARYHVSEILGKLGVEGREEAARWRPVEGRRPWWTAALLPVAALWRKAGALPVGLSTAATAVSGGLLVAAFAGLGLMAFLLVRAGDEEGPRLVADSPTATVEETPRRTGIAEVDAILDAVESGEPDRVRALVRFTPVPCEPPTSVRGVVVCEPDQEEGSPVDVIPVSLCEESAMGRDDLDFYLRTYMVDPSLYGVYRAPPAFEPPAQYVAVFSKAPHAWTEVLAIAIDEGEIVKILFAMPTPSGCAQTPAAVVRSLGLEDAVLPPPPTTPRRTGIAEIDVVLDAVESGDPDRVLAFVRFTQVPCEPPETGAFRHLVCQAGQEEGTPVEFIPVSVCGEGPVRRDDLDLDLTGGLVDASLYGVYSVPPGFEPTAQYVAVFSKAPRSVLAVAIDQGRIVEIYFALLTPGACAQTAAGLVDGLGLEDAVLPPPATPSP